MNYTSYSSRLLARWLPGMALAASLLAPTGISVGSHNTPMAELRHTHRTHQPMPHAGQGFQTNTLEGVAALSSTDVWAVGWGSIDSRIVPVVEHWDGSTWQIVPNPPGISQAQLLAVAAVSATDVWAVGKTWNTDHALTVHWDGSSLQVVPSVSPSGYVELNGVVALAANDVWTVGDSGFAGDRETLIEHWNGSRWSVVYSPTGTYDYLEAVTAISKRDLWAMGSTDTKTQGLRYIGLSWIPVPSASFGFDATFEGVSGLAHNDVWAVGINGGAMSAHFDGTRWRTVPTPNPGALGSPLFAVVALASNDVWAVGASNGWSRNETYTLHWDGARWNQVPAPSPGSGFFSNTLYGVAAVSSTDIWAVGTASDDDGQLILHWNGSNWRVVPGPRLESSIGDFD